MTLCPTPWLRSAKHERARGPVRFVPHWKNTPRHQAQAPRPAGLTPLRSHRQTSLWLSRALHPFGQRWIDQKPKTFLKDPPPGTV